ncbi:flagellin B [Sulfurimonas sp. SWIR-19]|uniref:flagellin N-terminal helical domain-containing protein n=1 Tax=Sulfurimonas sp. SWIR-19 TaxID=2878390 RepID=UPI001CF5EA1B|nr:flagellin [Sulfurimonas sp. SWIR-19]UCN00473.1 flagellin B [Sulfurimonas sp. SWIR-19]
MGFRINTNVAAMNALRNATQTNLGLDKSLNALSSGLRINKAADDASGLAIANSLRQQAQGLGQAINNANDGIGVTQTADGALDEYTKIIDTVRTKAIQAASDGQTLDTRKKIQADIDRLLEEAQNIASTTSFNGQTLLNGAYQNKAFHVGAYAGETVKLSISDTQTASVSKFALAESTSGFTSTTAGFAGNTSTLSATVTNADGTTATVTASITIASGSNDAYAIAQAQVDAFNAAAQTAGADIRASLYEDPQSTGAAPEYGIRLDSAGDLSGISATGATGAGNLAYAATAASADLTNNLSTVDVTTRENAEKAVIIADYALRDVDNTRSDIGSVQNQLESTIRNISVTQVNVTAAESQIRDVDFAAESANFSKLNILAQSGSYAMSQANAVQQNVLRLLQ